MNVGFSSTMPRNAYPVAIFFFTVIVASYAEEKFFRFASMPTIYQLLNNVFGEKDKILHGIVAAVSVSIIFALYHYSILGMTQLIYPFIFSMIAIFGNYWRKSVFFGVGMHLAMNALWFFSY